MAKIAYLAFLFLLSCSSQNAKKNLVRVSVSFDDGECENISISSFDVGQSYEVFSDEQDRDDSVKDDVLDFESDLIAVKKVLSVPVAGKSASFEFQPDPEARKTYLICPPITSENFTPYNCFQPIGDGSEVDLLIRLYGKDCVRYQ